MASGYVYPLGRSSGIRPYYRGGKQVAGQFRTRFLDNSAISTHNEEEELDLLEGESLRENVLQALRLLSSRPSSVAGETLSKGKTLAYLNGLVKVLTAVGKDLTDDDEACLGLRLKEIMLCLRIPLTHEAPEVRAATLRVYRYIVDRPSRVEDFLSTNAHLLVTRCIDIDLNNRVERLQALRFIRKLLFSSPEVFPPSLCRSLIAVAEGGTKENDRLLRICLAIICEISVLNSTVFILCQGVRALTNSILDCSMPRMAEAMMGCLLRLYNNPKTRSLANINLGVVITPFTEFRYIHNWFSQKVPTPAEAFEDKALRFQCSTQAILSLLRSWPGLLQLCNISSKNSPLKTLVDILYVSNAEVRNLLIDLLYEILYLRVPKSSSDVKEVLEDIDPSSPRESWQLKEGFVASEGFDILPRLSKARPNIKESHLCVLIACLMEINLPEALVKVLVSSSLVLSIKATVLLGELLHRSFVLLPRETNYSNHCLPTLFDEVSSTDPERANRASQAVATLHRIHSIKKRGPRASSLFFYEILSGSERFPNGEGFIGDKLHNPGAWSQLLNKSADDRISIAIKESGVLSLRLDWMDWHWDQITVIFQCPSDNFIKNLESSTNKQFLRKIFDFFKPSNGMFSKIELSRRQSKEFGWIGMVFLDFLLKCGPGSEGARVLDEFLADIHYYLKAVITAESAHDCLISPTRIATTASQYYFLFIGHLSRSESGRNYLLRHAFLPSLADLLGMRSELYMKLVISSLDYSTEWGSRAILQRALVDLPEETPRLYATRFLGILIRSRSANVAQWGISLLIQQLYDPSPSISSTALELLDEACDDKMNLEAVICNFASQRSKFEERVKQEKNLRWGLILTRFVGSSSRFNLLSQINLIEEEIKKWGNEYNLRYVKLVEELLNESFTLHQKDEDGTYGRRKYGPHTVKDLFIPPHLYGQLAVSEEGLEILQRKDSGFWPMLQTIRLARMPEEDKALVSFKSAIWGICHVASSPGGAKIVEQHGGIRRIVDIALSNEIYSLRGTAYYALSLVATNRVGANALSSLNWNSLRFGREENWPVLEDWFVNQLYLLKERARTESEDLSEESEEFSSTNEDENQKTLTPANIDSYFGSTSFGGRPSGKSKLSSLFRSLSLSDSSGERVLSRLSEGRQSLSKKIKRSLSRRSSIKSSSRRDSNVSGKTTSSAEESTEAGHNSCSSKRLSFSSEVCDEDGASSLTDHSPVKAESVNAGLENIDEEDPPGAPASLPFFGELQGGAKNNYVVDSASTSGISSEDSCKLVVTTAPIPTAKLSPIPSLMDEGGFMAPHPRSGQRAFSESEALPNDVLTMKNADLGGGSVSSVCSIGSWTTENSGYRTIRGIHSRRRPLLSESEADPETNSQNAADLTGSANSETYRRSSGGLIRRKDSWTHKSKSLDYRLTRLRKNNAAGNISSNETSSGLPCSGTQQQMTSPVELIGGQEPQYRGIAIPAQVTALFPVSRDKEDSGDLNLSQPAPGRSNSTSFFGLELHTPQNCLSCYRINSPCKTQSSSRSRTCSLTNPVPEKLSAESVSSGGSPSNLRKMAVSKAAAIADSTDSVVSAVSSDPENNGGDRGKENSFLGKVLQRKEVLKLIDSMMHFSTKTPEQGLLKMKQKFPNLFNDLCLYSEVSLLLSKYTYRLSSRRFIQELFIDLRYDDLYEEPAQILKIEDDYLENVREMSEISSEPRAFNNNNT